MNKLTFTPAQLQELAALQPVAGASDDHFLSQEEAQAVTAYLTAFPVVLRTTVRHADVLSESDDEVVPSFFRSDGAWVWSGAVEYYVKTHRVSPGAEFLAHLAAVDYQTTEPPVEQLKAAAAFLTG